MEPDLDFPLRCPCAERMATEMQQELESAERGDCGERGKKYNHTFMYRQRLL